MYVKTGIFPKALANKPALDEDLVFYWEVFMDLSADRPEAFKGLRRIPLRSMLDYAKLHRFAHQDIEATWEKVRLIDGIWLRLQEERHAAKTVAHKSDAKNRPGG